VLRSQRSGGGRCPSVRHQVAWDLQVYDRHGVLWDALPGRRWAGSDGDDPGSSESIRGRSGPSGGSEHSTSWQRNFNRPDDILLRDEARGGQGSYSLLLRAKVEQRRRHSPWEPDPGKSGRSRGSAALIEETEVRGRRDFWLSGPERVDREILPIAGSF